RRRNTAASSSVLLLISVSCRLPSAACQFCLVSRRLQVRAQLLAMVALNLDYTIFHGATGATVLLEFTREFLQCLFRKWNTADQRNALTPTTLGFTTDPHGTVALDRLRLLRLANAGSKGLATIRTQATGSGGI